MREAASRPRKFDSFGKSSARFRSTKQRIKRALAERSGATQRAKRDGAN